MAADLLSTIRLEIDERLRELRPLLAEQQRLLDAANALLEEHRNGVEPPARTVGKAAVGARTGKRVPATRSRRSPATPKAKTVPAAKPNARAESRLRSEANSESASQLEPKPERAARGAAREAILGALDHGSHTVGELVVVTAMSAPNVNGNLRRLQAEGIVVKAEREGKAAWALLAATD